MVRILRKPLAKADLRGIFRFIAKDSPHAARTYLRDLDETIRRVAVLPFIGSARLPNYPDMRVFPCRNHLLIYRPLPEGDGIELIRVFHGAQDWQAVFTDTP